MYILITTLAAGASPLSAEIQCNQFEIKMYSRIWQVTSYFVQDDLALNPNKDFEMLEPEGIAYNMGSLYVSGDRELWNTNSRLAVYTWQSDILAYSGFRQMPNTSPDWWGPDGLAFNLSADVNSYGSDPNELVSIEADSPLQAGIVDISTGSETGKKPIASANDIAHISSTGQFALIADGNEYSTVTIYDKMLDTPESNYPVLSGSRGLASMNSDFIQWLTGETVIQDGLLLTSEKDGLNKLVIYDLSGNQIGPEQILPVLPSYSKLMERQNSMSSENFP